VRVTVVAALADALAAAQAAARARGLRAVVVRDALRGEARVQGRRLAALGRAVRASEPVCLLGGGETTVTLRGSGSGGRNQELALAAALALAGSEDVALLAVGTDGSDGPTDAAGAVVDGGTVARGAARGADARGALAANDSHGFFAAEGGLLRTGPTRTNVMDLVALRVAVAPAGPANLPFSKASESV
jgi:hydroxypyruvate reductase